MRTVFINGELVRAYRESNGISLDDMADTIGIDPSLLDRYENGEPWEETDLLTLLALDAIFIDDEEAKYIILEEI